MDAAISSKVDLRTDYTQILIFVLMCFGVFFASARFEYKAYLLDYKTSQLQEKQEATQKITTTLKDLKSLTLEISKTIGTYSDDYQKIDNILSNVTQIVQNYNVPAIPYITYCRKPDPKEKIIPSVISPQGCQLIFQRSAQKTKVYPNKDYELIETVPVFDKQTCLKGVLEIRVPFADMQKFIGVDKMRTLEFPKIFDNHGKRLIQDDIFNFSLKDPLVFREYLSFYRSHFFMLSMKKEYWKNRALELGVAK